MRLDGFFEIISGESYLLTTKTVVKRMNVPVLIKKKYLHI